MSGHVQQTINDLRREIETAEAAIAEKKKTVNSLCDLAKVPHLYLDVMSDNPLSFEIRPDQYYGKVLTTAVREYLEMRKAMNLGAANLDEIYTALEQGGFAFEGKFAKRGLGIALSKNSRIFHRLPNNTYGLLKWYSSVPRSTKAGNQTESDAAEADEKEEPTDEEGNGTDG